MEKIPGESERSSALPVRVVYHRPGIFSVVANNDLLIVAIINYCMDKNAAVTAMISLLLLLVLFFLLLLIFLL